MAFRSSFQLHDGSRSYNQGWNVLVGGTFGIHLVQSGFNGSDSFGINEPNGHRNEQ